MATLESLILQIKSLETQLAVIRKQLENLNPAPLPRTFGDLYGIVPHEGGFTEEEIDAVLLRLDLSEWEEDSPAGEMR